MRLRLTGDKIKNFISYYLFLSIVQMIHLYFGITIKENQNSNFVFEELRQEHEYLQCIPIGMFTILVFSHLRFLFLLQSFDKCSQLPGNIFATGCLNVTEKFVKDHAAIIGGAGIGVACLMVSNKSNIQNTVFHSIQPL